MSVSPHGRPVSRPGADSHPRGRARTGRALLGAVGALGLVALGAVPAAVAADGPGLVVGGVAPVGGLQPGSTFDVPVTVADRGTEPHDKVWVQYSVTRGLDFKDLPSNCQAWHAPAYDEMLEQWNAFCEFDQTLKPDVKYTPSTPLTVKVLGRSYHDTLSVSVWDTVPDMGDVMAQPVPGKAPAVSLVAGEGGSEATDDSLSVPVTSANKADFKVTGALVKGSVGDTVPMKVTFKNAGPAWVLRPENKPIVTVLVKPPAGTSVVKPGGFCEKQDDHFECGTSQRWVNEDGGETYAFSLKIDKKVKDAAGTVSLAAGQRPFDDNKQDDTAPIELRVSDSDQGSGPGKGDGGDGKGSGSDTGKGGSGDGSGSGSGSGHDSGSGTSGTTGGSGSANGDDSLAHTGSSDATLPIAFGSAALVAAGAATVFAVRRRKVVGRG